MDKKIGHYQIVRLLGSGGMGQVFEAVHDQMKRRAAIKVLHKRFTSNRQIAARFLNEARATSIVEHPSLVHIYEFGQTEDGTAYIVMEFLDGMTLRQRLESEGGKLPPETAMRLTRQIASALNAAHQKGIIHRDLKPVDFPPDRATPRIVPQRRGGRGLPTVRRPPSASLVRIARRGLWRVRVPYFLEAARPDPSSAARAMRPGGALGSDTATAGTRHVWPARSLKGALGGPAP